VTWKHDTKVAEGTPTELLHPVEKADLRDAE